MMLLVDSSILIGWLRRRIDAPTILARWLRSGQLVGCGVVRAEVLRGIVNPKQRDRVSEFLHLFPEVPTDADLWSDVAAMAWSLDRQGVVLPLSDLVIGCCARRASARLLTSDPHFGHIPDLNCISDLPEF